MQVIRASEPSLVLGHDNKSLMEVCSRTEKIHNSFKNISQNAYSPQSRCLSLWAESLGARSSMGKILLQHQDKLDVL